MGSRFLGYLPLLRQLALCLAGLGAECGDLLFQFLLQRFQRIDIVLQQGDLLAIGGILIELRLQLVALGGRRLQLFSEPTYIHLQLGVRAFFEVEQIGQLVQLAG